MRKHFIILLLILAGCSNSQDFKPVFTYKESQQLNFYDINLEIGENKFEYIEVKDTTSDNPFYILGKLTDDSNLLVDIYSTPDETVAFGNKSFGGSENYYRDKTMNSKNLYFDTFAENAKFEQKNIFEFEPANENVNKILSTFLIELETPITNLSDSVSQNVYLKHVSEINSSQSHVNISIENEQIEELTCTGIVLNNIKYVLDIKRNNKFNYIDINIQNNQISLNSKPIFNLDYIESQENYKESDVKRYFSRAGIYLQNYPKKAFIHKTMENNKIQSYKLIEALDNQYIVYNTNDLYEKLDLYSAVLSDNRIIKSIYTKSNEKTLLDFGNDYGKQFKWFNDTLMYKQLLEAGEKWKKYDNISFSSKHIEDVNNGFKITFIIPKSKSSIFLFSEERTLIEKILKNYRKWWEFPDEHEVYEMTVAYLDSLNLENLFDDISCEMIADEKGKMRYLKMSYMNIIEEYYVLSNRDIDFKKIDEEKYKNIQTIFDYIQTDEKNGLNILDHKLNNY